MWIRVGGEEVRPRACLCVGERACVKEERVCEAEDYAGGSREARRRVRWAFLRVMIVGREGARCGEVVQEDGAWRRVGVVVGGAAWGQGVKVGPAPGACDGRRSP